MIGEDPRAVQRLYWDMLRLFRQNLGGTSHKAIAGVELALWDIKAKALGVPVYELFGGPFRDSVRLYWSHRGTTRARYAERWLRTTITVISLISTRCSFARYCQMSR
jgi:L-alanine-DL-glutamate epimerase-like enolase superfamily enzyme